jgi:hypothetical protein
MNLFWSSEQTKRKRRKGRGWKKIERRGVA